MTEHRVRTHVQGCVEIVVYRPVLDDAARQKREDAVRRAVTMYGKEAMKRREGDVDR